MACVHTGPVRVPFMPTEKQIAAAPPPRKWLRFCLLTALLWLAWGVYTQDLHPASLLTGLVLAGLAAWFSYPFFFESIPKGKVVLRVDLMLLFLVLLLYQSIASSVSLIYLMLKGRYDPGIVRVKTHLQSPIGRALLANTISLLPGTLVLWMDGPYLFVHWFDKKTGNRVHAGRLIMEPMQSLLGRIVG